jgi:hypothetical protein
MLRRALLLSLAFTPIMAKAWADDPCCGPITPAGQRLITLFDSMDVEHHWLNHQHVNWETGVSDRGPDYVGHDMATHCSAFAAAVGKNLNVYMLRPPEHPMQLLASAQTAWFNSDAARAAGWNEISGWQAAQSLANQGQLVVISYASPNPHKPGHIVVVRPSLKTAAQLALEGPDVIQAATRNKADWPAAQSFTVHPGAWPNGVRIFAHDVPPVA